MAGPGRSPSKRRRRRSAAAPGDESLDAVQAMLERELRAGKMSQADYDRAKAQLDANRKHSR